MALSIIISPWKTAVHRKKRGTMTSFLDISEDERVKLSTTSKPAIAEATISTLHEVTGKCAPNSPDPRQESVRLSASFLAEWKEPAGSHLRQVSKNKYMRAVDVEQYLSKLLRATMDRVI
ncbi:hypothetical protein [Glutamicibacter arilaitensis]|nr:hypothetical protein [Glutamicibacter arilaitensis]